MSQRCAWPNEQAATMIGSVVKIATLDFNPVMLIFDNQGSASVAISVNDPTGASVWHTFPAGEAIIMDMRANHGIASNFCPSIGDTFYGNGASGTFSISYVYAASNH